MNTKPAWKRLVTNPVFLFVICFTAFVGALSLGLSSIEWKETITIRETRTITIRELPDSVKIVKGFARDCTLLGGHVAGIAGVYFCIDAMPVRRQDGTTIIWDARGTHTEKYQTSSDCLTAGGKIIDLSPAENDKGCYIYTIFEELGARHDYRPTN